MRVIIVEPGKPGYPAEISGSLESMQQIVGGLIQETCPWPDDTVSLVCNEEGRLLDLPMNRLVDGYDVIHGPFFICGTGEEDFCGLSDAQAERYGQMFQSVDQFVSTSEGLACFRTVPEPGQENPSEDTEMQPTM